MTVAPPTPPHRHGSTVRTLAEARRELWRHRSPRVLGAGIALALIARVAAGGPATWRDPLAVAAMLAIFPFGEWAIHVHLLHLRPLRWRGRERELVTAASHRQHHERPHHLGLILLGPAEALALLVGAVPLVVGTGTGLLALAGVDVRVGPVLTATLTTYVLIALYEWTHLLIHTAHRPRTRFYRAIHRAHRLHHFKNEHYWHGITSTVADRVLGTATDHASVERSPTARTLAER
ncbi:MAG: Fatty acid hydroxylase superfamily protein [Solirubrobacterales bacterium]|nr:Fatty acid hydroxylase superfamily protein [Solirubrobacterales bacterium]